MRYILFGIALSSCLLAQDWRLLPLPRQITRGAGSLTLRPPVRVAVLSESEEDRFAAGLLVEELRNVAHLEAEVVPGGSGAILMDGLLPSLRDAIHDRPYWLDNVLVRYDAEALYWVQKMRLFDNAALEQQATRALPNPEKLGLYFP